MARNADRVALVTGCSAGGIGYAIAEELARRGVKVYATARKPERMAGLEPLGCTLLALDTTKQASIDAAAKHVFADHPEGIDLLINNAGVAMRGPVLDTPVEDVQALFAVNYTGCVSMVRAFAPAMLRERRGTIVNVGSASGFWSTPFMAHYSASKAALQAFSDALRLELAPFNVHVVHAAPGFVKTEIFNKGAEAGYVHVDASGPFAPVQGDIQGDVYSSIGRFPVDAKSFARRFAAMALGRRPPALYLDGRWSLTTYITGLFLPRSLVDIFATIFFGCWKLTTWYPHAPSLVEAGPGPALLGTHPAPTHDDTPVAAGVVGSRAGGHGPPLVPAAAILEGATGLMPASPPAGVGAQGEDVAGMVASRDKAARKAVQEGPIGGPPNKPEERVPVDLTKFDATP